MNNKLKFLLAILFFIISYSVQYSRTLTNDATLKGVLYIASVLWFILATALLTTLYPLKPEEEKVKNE